MFKKILFSLFLFSPSLSLAATELPFTDVSVGDSYYTDLKYIYNAGIISDTPDHLFRPNGLLPRDEFAGTVVGVSCRNCISPSIEDIIRYNQNPFIDVLKKNQYFYCISYAKEKEIVRGYVLDQTGNTQCQDKQNFSSIPFCPANNVTRIEATAVLLRQAGLWSEAQNSASYEKKIIISDVDIYWYGYAQKAIEVGLITVGTDGKIFPNEYLTRKEFVIMASKIFAINMCSVKSNTPEAADFASIIKIFDKDKTSSSKNPNITTFPDNTETIYDFGGYATGTLSAPLTYNWTFTNTVTGEQKFATGSYLDNFDLVSAGLWNVKLVTSDATGHSSTAYQEVFVQANGISTQIGIPSDSIQGIIKIFDTEKQNCSPTDNVTVFPDNTQTIYDFGGYANETLIPPLTYNWTFINSITGEQKLANGSCLNNYNL